MWHKAKQNLQNTIIFLGLITASWFLLIKATDLPPFILPDPATVLRTALENSSLILLHARYTVIETMLGLIGGLLLGLSSAIIIFLSPSLRRFFHPLLITSQALPTFVIAPLFVMWLGYGMGSKIATTILMIYFPITSSFYDGLSQCPRLWQDMAKTMTHRKWRILVFIHIPAALPQLASGIRVATVIAPIGAVIGEWVGASHGLGYLMLMSNARLQIPLLFAALITVILLSLLLYFTVDQLLKLCLPWILEIK